MPEYTVHTPDHGSIKVQADDVSYDAAGNLVFFNVSPDVMQPGKEKVDVTHTFLKWTHFTKQSNRNLQ